MSKPMQRHASPKAAATQPQAVSPGIFTIPYPMLLLALAAFFMYVPSLSFGVTELDDIIFIRDFAAYNEDLGNLVTSFQRGLFDAVKDPYYRPLFMDSMILNFHASDGGQSFTSYHFINILLHVASVLLLYKLLLKLNTPALHAFLLTLLFAVLPVLSQAVAWIPGRNDTMLAVFILSFFLCCINYSAVGKIRDLLLSTLFLLLAFFTKETAVFAPPAAFVLLVLALGRKWQQKNNLILYGTWIACFLVWFVARSQATTAVSAIAPAGQILHRLPVIIQYLGKIFFPFNLSVFPELSDTVYYWGIAATLLLTAAEALSKNKDLSKAAAGAIIFLLFLMPALLVPDELNRQMFEHRLYLPVIGVLLLLSQSVLVRNKLGDKQVAGLFIGVCLVFAAINYQHQKSFESPITFWTQAVTSTPNSSYANMMLAARLGNDETARSAQLFRKAYQINPREKYLNYYYGVMLQKQDSVLQSEKYLLTEKQISDYYECDFYLARVAMQKQDRNSAIAYLESFLKRDPMNPQANQNLFLLYRDTNQPEKAAAQAKKMQTTNP